LSSLRLIDAKTICEKCQNRLCSWSQCRFCFSRLSPIQINVPTMSTPSGYLCANDLVRLILSRKARKMRRYSSSANILQILYKYSAYLLHIFYTSNAHLLLRVNKCMSKLLLLHCNWDWIYKISLL